MSGAAAAARALVDMRPVKAGLPQRHPARVLVEREPDELPVDEYCHKCVLSVRLVGEFPEVR